MSSQTDTASYELFLQKLIRNALRAGVSHTRSVVVTILGISESFAAPDTKKITASYSSNFTPSMDYDEYWLNMDDGQLYLKDQNNVWGIVKDYAGVFIGDGTALQGNTATGPIYQAVAPVLPNELVNKQYVDSLIAQVASNIVVPKALGTLDALRAMDLTNVPDQTVVSVAENQKLYTYESKGIGDDDNTNIIKPKVGVGRWLTTVPNVIDAGYF